MAQNEAYQMQTCNYQCCDILKHNIARYGGEANMKGNQIEGYSIIEEVFKNGERELERNWF